LSFPGVLAVGSTAKCLGEARLCIMRTEEAMIFAFQDTELDLRQGELRRAGGVVHVEPQVFDLLVFLIRNRDRIVSKDEILDAVWDGRSVSEAALSSRINAARKALGDNGNEQAVIRTFHKRGFRFVIAAEERGDEAPRGPAAARQNGDGAGPIGATLAPAAAAQGGEAAGMPSVAVLPFVNVTADPEHEYFAYGLTEDIIRLLGRNRGFRVLTRHTTAAYRGLDVDVREVGATLGVRYVVEGSVRKIGDDLRITAELASTADGRQLWSDVYEFNLPQIFDVQESMARQIAAVVEPELATIEQELASRRPPESLDAWDCYQRAFWHLWGFTTPGFDDAEAMFRRAIELEPGLPRAHAGLSYVLLQKTFHGDPQRRAELLQEAMSAARTSVGLDDRDPLCRCVLGRVYCLHQQYQDAVVELEETIANSPSFAQGYFALAFTLVWCGRAEEAIPLLETACELSPRDPHLWAFHQTRAFAHMALGELESAEFFARQACRHPNAPAWPHATFTSVLGLLGKGAEAAVAFHGVESRRAGYRQASARDDLFFCADEGFIARYIEGLARAGVPA
jgi:TolB-like protein/DNA-binding winged helix-turn-helix (wHTH) protein